MSLRERGLYCLPNRRIIVVAGDLLISPTYKNDVEVDAKSYQINHQGKLVADGRLTGWAISDLSDTGLTDPVIVPDH